MTPNGHRRTLRGVAPEVSIAPPLTHVRAELPAPRGIRSRLDDAADRLVGFDPGLNQLRTALQAVLGIGVAITAEFVFVRVTGVMQIQTHGAALPPAQAAAVSAQHHGVLVIAMLLGALMAMVGAFVVSDPTPRGQLITTVALPVPFLASMSIGLLLGPYRLPSLAWLVVALTLGTYLRRFGPRGFGAGMLVFNGGFIGFFLHAEIPARDIGWIAAELGIGMLAALVVRFGIFRPHNGRTLVRMQRSWVARSRRLIDLALLVTQENLTPEQHERRVRQLHRQAVRVNESTLMIDGQLAQPGASASAALLHQRLYDLELALSNVARFAEALSLRPLEPSLRRALQAVLRALAEEDLDAAVAQTALLLDAAPAGQEERVARVLVHRLAGSVQLVVSAQREWLAAGQLQAGDGSDQNFVPAVGLANGWLPGSVPVSNRASTTPDSSRWFGRLTLAPEIRASIQVAVAAIIAISVGDAVNGQRFYWGLLAVFLAFMATTNAGEQIRKALFRAGGTAIGIVIGDLIVHASGGTTPAVIAVVLVALFFGIYLIRINYMFMVIGITITMSQLYRQLGEFSWHLLLLRLGETAIGAGAVVLTVLLVVPLRPQRVLRAGILTYFEELQTLTARSISAVVGGPLDPDAKALIRADVRRLDAAYHAFITTARPLRSGTFGRNSLQLTKVLAISTAMRAYARNLANGVLNWSATDCPSGELARATAQLSESMDAVRARIELERPGAYMRSAALFDVVDQQLSSFDDHAVMRDFTMLDAALARLASALDMPVHDHDTESIRSL
jgi:hypothetical protein